MERTWTKVGEKLVERVGGQDAVEATIDGLMWQNTETETVTVGFIPGEAIKAAVAELRIPKVSAIAIDSFSVLGETGDDDGFYPGFYGIEGNYANGRAHVYVLDDGLTLTPLVTDFEAMP